MQSKASTFLMTKVLVEAKMETFKLGKRMTPAELLLAYKAALETIAKGSADAANIAQEALKL
jgi:hypothetical protein